MKKKILTNGFYLLLICSLYVGCRSQTFAPDKFVFDIKFDSLYRGVSKNDTILFENNKNSIDTFILTKIDSITSNRNQTFCLMCPRSFKTIYRNYKQYPINYWTQSSKENKATNQDREITEEKALISITKSPQNDSTTAHISFKNFECEIQYSFGKKINDSIFIGKKYFSNYYIFNSTAKSLIIKDEDVETVYISLIEGIIAYKEKSGILRKRIFFPHLAAGK